MYALNNLRRLWVTVLNLAALCFIMPVGADTVSIEKISFEGWENAYRMSNGEVELVAVADIGPRILRFNRVGHDNVFSIEPSTKGQTGGDEWRGYGGHRLWIAPESLAFTYYPDNTPVKADIAGSTLTLTALPEMFDETVRQEVQSFDALEEHMDEPGFRKQLGIQKKMIITMDEDGTVTIDHEIKMHSQTMTLAPWVLTVMNQGGLTIVPNPPYAPHGPGHYLPVRGIIVWSYTDLTDPRLTFGEQYTTIRQDPDADSPFKIGFSETQGWAAYAYGDQLFVKHLEQDVEAHYPDMNSSVEIFTNGAIMEIESLGPLKALNPGETIRHRERWQVHVIEPIDDGEEDIDRVIEQAGLN